MRTNLRAFAIGILFATGVMGVAYSIVSANTGTLNDESVKAYAEENNLTVLTREEYNELLPPAEPKKETKTETKEPKDSDKEKQEASKEQKQEEEANEPFEVVIPDGMATYEITALLAEKGIINDDKEFDKFLEDRGIATKVRSGTFMLKKGMSYQEAVDVLIK
ncbi:YceG-like family protein [Bacillus sp. THAF10]|uniref:hypothetical protein n=1 Tax=Bacillus sp. THAF10 TaxID=2587848 RepID=UPI001267A1FC|nr:hypothetical protein [Bacillus sp. THAF10]QFT89844.1 YceG-like family protein [Bacillus sp. THAF10]